MIIKPYTLNLYSATCQLYISKTRKIFQNCSFILYFVKIFVFKNLFKFSAIKSFALLDLVF